MQNMIADGVWKEERERLDEIISFFREGKTVDASCLKSDVKNDIWQMAEISKNMAILMKKYEHVASVDDPIQFIKIIRYYNSLQ